MMFIAKKILSAFIMPLPVLLLLGLFGLILLYRERPMWLAKLCLSLSLLGIAALSFYPLASTLFQPYEQQYSAYDTTKTQQKPAAVVVLGHSHVNDPDRPLAANLSGEALARLVEGIRIWRSQPTAYLVLTGYDGGTGIPHAFLMAETAVSIGMPRDSIKTLDNTKDTAHEAQAVKALIGEQPFVLVSSASHLPRAMQTFEQLGMHPTPAPAFYLAPKEINQSWHYWSPKAKYLYLSERWWHERLGKIWQSSVNDDAATSLKPAAAQ